jgi:hypothetical protein
MVSNLKIGWKDYKIIITEPKAPLHIHGIECFGKIDYLDQKIFLRRANTEEQMIATLIHEVLHGIGDMYQIESLTKEKLTTKLADALYTILKDNNLEITKKGG